VRLLGASLFLPHMFLAPLVIGTYLVRGAWGFARWGLRPYDNCCPGGWLL